MTVEIKARAPVHEIWLCRAVVLVLLAAAMYHNAALDQIVASLWHSLRNHWYFKIVAGSFSNLMPIRLVKHDSFEPLLASAAFAMWVWYFRAIDVGVPALHRYRIGGPASAKHAADYTSFS